MANVKLPTVAWIETCDGERVDCLIEPLGATQWQAVPVRDVALADMRTGYVDVLPAGHKISFLVSSDDDDDDG